MFYPETLTDSYQLISLLYIPSLLDLIRYQITEGKKNQNWEMEECGHLLSNLRYVQMQLHCA